MTSTWLTTPMPATTAGTPLVSSPRDSLPTLLDDEGDGKLEEYFLSTQDLSSVLDRKTFAVQLQLPQDDTVCHIYTSYGTTIICFANGRISIGSSKPSMIYATPNACEHGIRERVKKQIYALSAVCSQTDVVVVTASDGLWTFPIERQKEVAEVPLRDENTIFARQLCAERCLSVRAGSDFFIALVESAKRSEEREEEKENEDVCDEPHHSPCRLCNEDRRMRLSHLMREADREAEERAATVRFRQSRPSSTADRRTALQWNGQEHGGVRAPSMLALSEESAASDDGVSMRAVRGDSPNRAGRRETRESSSAEEQRDWLGRGGEGREVPIRVSVLTWGSNGSGQLGHGDNVQRSQPQSIGHFDAARRVCGIAAGNAHAAALTAAGTAFVWGANVWSDERSTVLSPTLFKTGESSSVLDVTASGDALAVLVVDKEGATSILLARGGGVSRLSGAGKSMTTMGVRLMEDGRMLMRTKGRESTVGLSAWRESIGLCRLLSNLDELGKHCLQERIKQNSSASLDAEPVKTSKKSVPSPQLGTVAEASRLIRKLNKALARFVALAAIHADRVRGALRADSEDTVAGTSQSSAFDVLNSPRFRAVFTKFVDAYVTARAYGALEALPFTSDSAVRFVDKLSLTYDVSSTRSDSVVRKLFSLPLEFLRRSVDEFVRMTSESSDSGPSGYATEWSHQLAEAAAALETAATTAVWWRREANAGLARTLHKPRRLLVWSGGTWSGAINEGGLLSVVARSAGLLSARYTHVLVFNDLIVFATRNSDQRFPTQLVWMSDKKEEIGDKKVLHVDTPDEKFDLEFASKDERDVFKRRVSFWYWSNFAVETKTGRSASSPAPSSSLVLGEPPATRRAERFVFAKTGESYTGEWRHGVPHGRMSMPLPAHYFATAGGATDTTDAGQQMHPAVLQHLLQQQQMQQQLALLQLQQAGGGMPGLGGFSTGATGATLAPPTPLYTGAPLMQPQLAATAAMQQLQQLPIAARSESASSTSASSSVENNQPPSSPPSTSRSSGDAKDAVRLHISNIPYKWRNPDLEKLFAVHGEVIEAEVIFNERGSKGFGFITMATKEGADAAKAAIHQKLFDNRMVEVNPATMKMSGRQKAKVLQATHVATNPHLQLAMLQQQQLQTAAADPQQMALQQLLAAQAILAQYSVQQQQQQMLQGLQQPAMQQQWMLQQQLTAAAAAATPAAQLEQHQRRMTEELAKQQRYRPY